MRTWRYVTASVLFSLFLATFMLAQPGSGKRGGGWGWGSAYGRMYDPNTVETVSGEVVKVEKFTPLRGMSGGIHVMLKTGPEEISVHLGPAWFFENQEQQIEVKDRLEVTGSRIAFEGKPAIIAREVKKGEDILVLRNEQGIPQWSGWRGGKNAGQPGWGRQHRGGRGQGQGKGQPAGHHYNLGTVESFSGKVLAVERVDSRKGNWKGLHLQVDTGKEKIAVHLGPEWYMGKHDIDIAAGDQLNITGSRVTEGENTYIIAGEIRKGEAVYTLRDEAGKPAWKGWRQGKF